VSQTLQLATKDFLTMVNELAIKIKLFAGCAHWIINLLESKKYHRGITWMITRLQSINL
jgi:hypothetical protein